MSRKTLAILWAFGLVAACTAPFVIYPIFLMNALCFALFACAFNLLLGYAGLLSFGHAAFFGTASYVCGYAAKSLGLSPLLAIPLGALAAALLGLLFGLLSIRRQGIYFAMITLALAQMMFFLLQESGFTGGENGLQGIPRGTWLENDRVLYFVVLGIFLFGCMAIHRIIHSHFGQVLRAIRENEPRALSMGYDVDRFKLVAFVLSAAISGLAGATNTIVLGFATLTSVEWRTSGEVILMTLLGGMGTVTGPVIGAFAVVGLQNRLADKVGSLINVILGALFVVCVLLFRRGIVGELTALYERTVGEARTS